MNQKDLKDENKVKQDTIYWARIAKEEIKKGKEEKKDLNECFIF